MNDNSGMGKKWLPSLLTFVFWCLLGAGIAFWLLYWFGNRSVAAPDYARVAGEEVRVLRSNARTLTAALGGRHFTAAAAPSQPPAPAAPQMDSAAPIDPKRFRMGGILAQSPGSDGLVILSVDGEPAKLFSKGETVTEGVVLQSLTKTTASLAADMQASDRLTLEIGKNGGSGGNRKSGGGSGSGGTVSGADVPSLDSFFAAAAEEPFQGEEGIGAPGLTDEEAAELTAELAAMQKAFEQQQQAVMQGMNPPDGGGQEEALQQQKVLDLVKELEEVARQSAAGQANETPAAAPAAPLLLGQQPPPAPVSQPAPAAGSQESLASRLKDAIEQEKEREQSSGPP